MSDDNNKFDWVSASFVAMAILISVVGGCCIGRTTSESVLAACASRGEWADSMGRWSIKCEVNKP